MLPDNELKQEFPMMRRPNQAAFQAKLNKIRSSGMYRMPNRNYRSKASRYEHNHPIPSEMTVDDIPDLEACIHTLTIWREWFLEKTTLII